MFSIEYHLASGPRHILVHSAAPLPHTQIHSNIYSNKSWSIIAQGMFQLCENNQMERDVSIS